MSYGQRLHFVDAGSIGGKERQLQHDGAAGYLQVLLARQYFHEIASGYKILLARFVCRFLHEANRQAGKIHETFLASLERARVPAHNSTQFAIDEFVRHVNVGNAHGSHEQWWATDLVV